MPLLVQKFGGTSVGSIERIEAVAEKLIGYRDAGNDLVVVVSAMSGETNRLIELAQQVDPQARGRELDVLLTTPMTGRQIIQETSARMMSAARKAMVILLPIIFFLVIYLTWLIFR